MKFKTATTWVVGPYTIPGEVEIDTDNGKDTYSIWVRQCGVRVPPPEAIPLNPETRRLMEMSYGARMGQR